jgi:hypothetical protein
VVPGAFSPRADRRENGWIPYDWCLDWSLRWSHDREIGGLGVGSGCIRLTSCSSVPNARKRIISIVRFVCRDTLFYDEDITALPRLVSAVYVRMKAMEMSR